MKKGWYYEHENWHCITQVDSLTCKWTPEQSWDQHLVDTLAHSVGVFFGYGFINTIKFLNMRLNL